MFSEHLELWPLPGITTDTIEQILLLSESRKLFDKHPHYPRIYRLMYIFICIADSFKSMKHKRF